MNLLHQLGKKCGCVECDIIYDTDRNGWNNIPFFKTITNKQYIMVINITESDVFGCQCISPISPSESWSVDSTMFTFYIEDNTIQFHQQKEGENKFLCRKESPYLYGCYNNFGIQSQPNTTTSKMWKESKIHSKVQTNHRSFETKRVIVVIWESEKQTKD
ncbi:hypothetical protein QTN25_010534 [Entamoeba marina]